MKALGKDYSEKLQDLYNTLSPKPCICEYPQNADTAPRFAGKHVYQPAVGDLVFIASGQSEEYTFAHELMHVVLRREGYPHVCGRDSAGLDRGTALPFVQQLDGATLHPTINHRLAEGGIMLSREYAEHMVRLIARERNGYKDSYQIQPERFVILPLLLTEMVMWNLRDFSDELRQRINFPEAWNLTTEFLSLAHGIETGTPQRCRSFALDIVRAVDAYLTKRERPSNTFRNMIMIPPPPFSSDPSSPAKNEFKLKINEWSREQWEIEISSKADGIVCWSDGPFAPAKAEERLTLSRNALDRLSAYDFADFCERLFSTVIL